MMWAFVSWFVHETMWPTTRSISGHVSEVIPTPIPGPEGALEPGVTLEGAGMQAVNAAMPVMIRMIRWNFMRYSPKSKMRSQHPEWNRPADSTLTRGGMIL
jgi:hypothetical protein